MSKNQAIQTKIWAEDLNRFFSKEDLWIAKKAHENMFNITNYYRNANQSSNEVSPHSSQDGSSKNLQTINAGKGVENKGPSYTVGNVNCYSFYAEWYVVVLFMTVVVYPWTVAHQVPRSMGFFRQEYCSGLSFPTPRDHPDPRIEPASPASPSLAGEFLTTKPPGKPS